MRVYLDGSVDISYKNAINNERNGGGIDVKDTVKALAELPQNLEKNMLVIAKALRNEVDAYIPFEKADVKS